MISKYLCCNNKKNIYINQINIENDDAKTNQGKEALLPSPTFTSKAHYKGCITCQICFSSSSVKNLNRSNLQKYRMFITL